MPQIDGFAGHLFYRGVAPSEIKAMSFGDLRYWAGHSLRIDQEHSKAIKEAENGGN